jgi:ribosomal protein S18 acetylase RimI-like enzyme
VSFAVATNDDYNTLQRFIQDEWKEVELIRNSDFNLTDSILESTFNHTYGELLFDIIERGNALIIQHNDTQVGCVLYDINEHNQLFIYDLYIDPDVRKQNIASRVIHYLIDRAVQYEAREIYLWSDESNTPANNLYTKLGFKNVGTHKLHWFNEQGDSVKTNDANGKILKVSPQHEIGIHFDYIIVNYANPDMVGHTGDFDASVKSLESLDRELGRIVDLHTQGLCDMIIIADHGNIEQVGEIEQHNHVIDTKHNDNPVPCIFVTNTPIATVHEQSYSLLQSLATTEPISLMNMLAPNVDVTNQSDWLSEGDIPDNKIPLWYSGVYIHSL